MKQPCLDKRHRDKDGEIRKKNSNTLVRTLRLKNGEGRLAVSSCVNAELLEPT